MSYQFRLFGYNFDRTIFIKVSKFILFSLVITTLFRLYLASKFVDRAEGIDNLIQIVINGLRIDLATLSILSFFPMLLIATLELVGLSNWKKLVTHKIDYWFSFWILVIVFFELITPTFIHEFDIRPNRLFFEYLNSPLEVSSMLINTFPARVIFILLAVIIFSFLLLKRIRIEQQKLSIVNPEKDSIRASKSLLFTLYFVSLIILLTAARSGWQHRPINPGMVAINNDRLINSLPLNSFYSVAYAFYQQKHESQVIQSYGTIQNEKVNQLIREDMDDDFLFPNTESENHMLAPTSLEKDKNLLIIVMESHGAHFVKSLGGIDASPNIESWRKKSWFFENLYATGIRSARGLEAILTGFPPTPSKSVLKLPKSQENFFTIATALNQYDYQSTFIYGGESHFDNMKGFFLSNGFDQVFDQNDYDSPAFESSWGVSDEDLFEKVLTHLNTNKSGKQFVLAFTSSNHPPYHFPDGKIELYSEPKENAVNSAKYADFALGNFLNKMSTSKLLKDYVVVVIADHEDRVAGSRPVPYHQFKIPAFIISENTPKKIDTRLTSQIDIPTTLLSLLGINANVPMLGHDLSKFDNNKHQRAILQFGNNAAYLTRDGICFLQPNRKPLIESFDTTTISHADENRTSLDSNCEKALAYEYWSNRAYSNSRYVAN